MDRFNKITSFGATMGVMGNIMDYQSLKNSSIQVIYLDHNQAEMILMNAKMDLTEILKQKSSTQDYAADGN